jgi:hypothetical protein
MGRTYNEIRHKVYGTSLPFFLTKHLYIEEKCFPLRSNDDFLWWSSPCFAYNHSGLIQPISIFSASLAWLIFLPSLSHKEATHYTNAPVHLLPNNPIYVFPEMKLRGLVPNSYGSFMYLWAIYIFPWSVCLFGCSKIGRLILGIWIVHRYMNVKIGRQNIIILFWK